VYRLVACLHVFANFPDITRYCVPILDEYFSFVASCLINTTLVFTTDT